MTYFERVYMQLLSDFIEGRCHDDYALAAYKLGTSSSSVKGWHSYYKTNGRRGVCPTMRSMGKVLDRLGVTIDTAKVKVSDINKRICLLEKNIADLKDTLYAQ